MMELRERLSQSCRVRRKREEKPAHPEQWFCVRRRCPCQPLAVIARAQLLSISTGIQGQNGGRSPLRSLAQPSGVTATTES